MTAALLALLTLLSADAAKPDAGSPKPKPGAKAPSTPPPPEPVWKYATCSAYRGGGPCEGEFSGTEKGACEVCRESRRCADALEGLSRSLCEAYRESRPCSEAVPAGVDQQWCRVFVEGGSCDGLPDDERAACTSSKFPDRHRFWLY